MQPPKHFTAQQTHLYHMCNMATRVGVSSITDPMCVQAAQGMSISEVSQVILQLLSDQTDEILRNTLLSAVDNK